jgi:hypothetical protein
MIALAIHTGSTQKRSRATLGFTKARRHMYLFAVLIKTNIIIIIIIMETMYPK